MPTSVSVVEKKHLTDLSILKQCVLFHNIKASVMIYKLAKIVPLIDFASYISTQSDLAILIERLPAQQYLNIFGLFG